ncbi:hypothetical protein [Luteolibacter sp. Populi]|uniref:hypothetical protein n=1 Tax=Luteolibacter sp. Populi TaxID=3230487 RepID=UPI003465742F
MATLSSCSISTPDPSPTAAKWTEACSSCGEKHDYAHTFDALDYEVIADYAAFLKVPPRVYWKAPHGPEPSCDSSYAGLSWSRLHEDMPELKRATFESFLKRNRPIPAHSVKSWQVPGGAEIKIDAGKRSSRDALHLTRAGFDPSGRQALIYPGQGVMVLLKKQDGKWVLAATMILWIS